MPGGIPALVGPTGCGKSAVAETLALSDSRWQLINADPFQAYRGLDIGTAKPPATRRGLYVLMDCLDPTEALDAMAYAERMRHAIAVALAGGRLPLLVGGSGFYLQALQSPHDPEPHVDPSVLQVLRRRLATEATEVWSELRTHNPQLNLHVNDHYRLEKAWIRAFGRPVIAAAAGPVPLRYYGLWAEGDAYEDALRLRLERMFDLGWAAEAQSLARQYGMDAPALRALGYRELAARGELVSPELRLQIATTTRQYAKRQRTWFRAQRVRWFPAGDPGCKMTSKGAQNLILRLLQYRDACDHLSR